MGKLIEVRLKKKKKKEKEKQNTSQKEARKKKSVFFFANIDVKITDNFESLLIHMFHLSLPGVFKKSLSELMFQEWFLSFNPPQVVSIYL